MRTRARRSSAGRTLRLKGGAVGAQADLTADPIRGLQETLARMKQVAAGGVPAPVPEAPAPEALAVDPVAAPPALQPIVMPGPLPEMHIDNIAKMDNWDHRECSVANKAEWKTFMLELVLFFHCSASNLDECRTGMTMITQCKGMGWKNFSLELEHRAAVLYQDAIPCRFAGMPMVNAGPIVRAMLKLCKVFLKKKIADRMLICKQDELMSAHGFSPETLPPVLGGTCTSPTYEDWAKAQMAAREESKQKVKIV